MTDRAATEEKHKGYGFVTFASPADAQDAIDNMDLNELHGKVLRVNLARPSKMPVQGLGNKASASLARRDTRVCLTNSPLQLGSLRNGLSSTQRRWQRAVVCPISVCIYASADWTVACRRCAPCPSVGYISRAQRIRRRRRRE